MSSGFEGAETSKFNSAMFKIYRLNRCWSNVNNFWRAGKFDEMNWEMDIIWAELWCDSDKEHKDKIDQANEELSKIKRNSKNENEFVTKLKQKWFLLFEIEKYEGLGKSYFNEDEASLI